MRRLALPLLLAALAPATAGAQACLGRFERNHVGLSLAALSFDGSSTGGVSVAWRGGRAAAQLEATNRALWREAGRYRAWTLTGSRDLAPRRAEGGARWCAVAGVQELRGPVVVPAVTPGGVAVWDTDAAQMLRAQTGLALGRAPGARAGRVAFLPFARAAAVVQRERRPSLAGEPATWRGGLDAEAGFGLGGGPLLVGASLGYLAGLPDEALGPESQWFRLRLQMGLAF